MHQKTPPAYTEGVFHTTKDHAASTDALESPSLSLAGQTAIVNQAVLLAPVPRAPAPSRGKSLSGGDNVPMQVCSLLQWRDRSGLGRIMILFAGFSIKSSRNLNIGIADKMKSVGLVQIFCPVKETNRTHSQSYVEDLSTQTGRKRCAKTTVLNLSVLP